MYYLRCAVLYQPCSKINLEEMIWTKIYYQLVQLMNVDNDWPGSHIACYVGIYIFIVTFLLWLIDGIYRHRTESTLPKKMVYCLATKKSLPGPMLPYYQWASHKDCIFLISDWNASPIVCTSIFFRQMAQQGQAVFSAVVFGAVMMSISSGRLKHFKSLLCIFSLKSSGL